MLVLPVYLGKTLTGSRLAREHMFVWLCAARNYPAKSLMILVSNQAEIH